MTKIGHLVTSIDSRVWHGVEKMASTHPNTCRLLALPIAAGTFIRDTLTPPAKCVEEIIMTIMSIIPNETDKSEFTSRCGLLLTHSFRAIGYAILTPLSPLIGLIDAIISLFKMLLTPFKTAKINAAKQDFLLYLEEKNYSYSSYPGDGFFPFRRDAEFVQSAFDRFKNAVMSAQNHNEVAKLHFLDEEYSRNQIIHEITLKQHTYCKARSICFKKLNIIVSEATVESIEPEKLKLDKAWEKFDKQLIKATATEASTMVFNPS